MIYPACLYDLHSMTPSTPLVSRLRILGCAVLLMFSSWSFADFIVEDIRVEGAQNIETGTIFNYLPIKVGDRADEVLIDQSIKALFSTGFFRDVEVRQDGNVLILVVSERPAIATVEFSGNKDIKDEKIQEALLQVGVSEGRVFREALLDQLVKSIQENYFSKGRYSAKVDTVVTPLDLNRVAISITIDEGRVARIREINIVGNEIFTDKELRSVMSLGEESWHSFLSQTGRYSKEELIADLEAVRSFYLDRGYMNFELVSSDVSISQNKQDIFITLSVNEGGLFAVGAVTVEGGGGFSAEDLASLINMPTGEPFSQRRLVSSRTAIEAKLADKGYAFANVNAITDINDQQQTVDFIFAVDPGPLVYVRKINISGNQSTLDDTIRREMRQLEASVFSAEKVRRSRERITRLGFFEDVRIDLSPVAGATDQIDLSVFVKERPTGNFMFGAGYADSDGIFLVAQVQRGNLFGTGREMTDTASANSADYLSETTGGGLRYSIPMSEYNAWTLSGALEDVKLEGTTNTPPEYQSFIDRYPKNLDLNLSTSFSKDTRDSIFFPQKGSFRSVSAEMTVPGSDLEYYKLYARGSFFLNLVGELMLNIRGDVGYGAGYSGLSELPFYKNYYAGGASSVRGFESRSLGPISSGSDKSPLGGSLRTVANAEMFFPVPGFDDGRDKRLSLFFDSGQVFADTSNFDFGQIRMSVGGGFHWFSPVGPISLTYAFPLNDEPGDDVKKFQFTLGSLLR
ncbi:MAG: outer membrane protein assembly factor BamA [Gammaproteobacteria bacterium]|nr:outer membrane protein assembly factor BamA [Gammaproteobacteria bacterium]